MPKLYWLARFVPDARAREKLHGKQLKLSAGQQLELCRVHATGEYSIIDPARVRHPKDKPMVERSVQYARERFFKGGDFKDLNHLRSEAAR